MRRVRLTQRGLTGFTIYIVPISATRAQRPGDEPPLQVRQPDIRRSEDPPGRELPDELPQGRAHCATGDGLVRPHRRPNPTPGTRGQRPLERSPATVNHERYRRKEETKEARRGPPGGFRGVLHPGAAQDDPQSPAHLGKGRHPILHAKAGGRVPDRGPGRGGGLMSPPSLGGGRRSDGPQAYRPLLKGRSSVARNR